MTTALGSVHLDSTGWLALAALVVAGVMFVGLIPVVLLVGCAFVAGYGLDHNNHGVLAVGIVGCLIAALLGAAKRR